MSWEFKNAVKAALEAERERRMLELANQINYDLPTMKLTQGAIVGLTGALALVDQIYKEQFG